MTDNLSLFTNTPTKVKSQQHSLEKVAGGIELYVNTNKTESIVNVMDTMYLDI